MAYLVLEWMVVKLKQATANTSAAAAAGSFGPAGSFQECQVFRHKICQKYSKFLVPYKRGEIILLKLHTEESFQICQICAFLHINVPPGRSESIHPFADALEHILAAAVAKKGLAWLGLA